MWTLDYLDDLESDFCVFYRVDDMYEMPSDLFFRRALRVSAYSGVIAARAAEEQEKNGSSNSNVREAGLNDPALAGLVEEVSVGG